MPVDPLLPVPEPVVGLFPVVPVPIPPELDFSLVVFAPQVSEIMSTLATLNVFSLVALVEEPDEPAAVDDIPELPPFSHMPFTATSCPT